MLAQSFLLDEHSDDPGLIYMLPDFVANIKDCKYQLGWDTSYKNCQRVLSPLSVPHMSLYRHQERKAKHDRVVKASTTIVGGIDKGEIHSNAAPGDYHILLL